MNGIPKLLSGNLPTPVISILGRAASALWNYLFPAPQWGIFITGSASRAVTVTSVIEMTPRKESQVSDYKIEKGSFASYNKVERPSEIVMMLTREGNELERNELLTWLESNVKSTTLYDLVTPERRYSNMTLAGFSPRRTASNGAALIVVDTFWMEVREVTANYYKSVANPQDKATTPTSKVQATTPSTTVTQRAGLISWQ